MGARKTVAASRGQLVNIVAKLEQTKKQASVNAFRQAFKRLVLMDAEATLKGFRSPLVMLRAEARLLVAGKRKLARKKSARKKK